MPAPNEILPNQLLRLIGTRDAPQIVDVCTGEDFAEYPYVIPLALRHPHTDLQGVAAHLRTRGWQAEYLSGGMAGWRAHSGALALMEERLPKTDIWVTRHRPKTDRIACPWLIRRFISAQARFLFVAPEAVLDVAETFGAIAFDVEGVALSHEAGRCSFDAVMAAYGLQSPALRRMAEVMRGADTNRHDLHPTAAGLLALCVGLSRQYKDDGAQLDASLALFDALYAWARDGYEEGHDWPAARSKAEE